MFCNKFKSERMILRISKCNDRSVWHLKSLSLSAIRIPILKKHSSSQAKIPQALPHLSRDKSDQLVSICHGLLPTLLTCCSIFAVITFKIFKLIYMHFAIRKACNNIKFATQCFDIAAQC